MNKIRTHLMLCGGTGCHASGTGLFHAALQKELEAQAVVVAVGEGAASHELEARLHLVMAAPHSQRGMPACPQQRGPGLVQRGMLKIGFLFLLPVERSAKRVVDTGEIAVGNDHFLKRASEMGNIGHFFG